MKTFLVIIGLISNLLCFAQKCPEIHCNERTSFKFWMYRSDSVLVDTSRIRIDGVYFWQKEIKQLDGNLKRLHSFCRFFENGRVFFSCAYASPPSLIELNDLCYGNYGHYKVENNLLIIERWEPKAKYYYHCFNIGDVNIVEAFTYQRSRRMKREIIPRSGDVSFEFQKCELTSKTFW
jgi:hypothetical protein